MKRNKKLNEKIGYDSVNATDSMWNRNVSTKKCSDAKKIQQILGIEDEEGPGSLGKAAEPMKMMDLVYQAYENEDKNVDEDADVDAEEEQEEEESEEEDE